MISAEKKEKISTRRTYLLLSQALFSLLEENPFEKITLTQLCDASMVPRSTFYRYFEDKYDLLYYCLQTFFETVRLDRDIMYLKDGKGHAFVDKLISVIDQNKDSFTKICRTNKNGIFMDILRNYLMQIIEQILHQLQKEGCALKISQPVFTYLLADLYISMAKCYLEADHGQDPGSFARDVCLFAVRDFFS
ncbi:MAG: TetR family transcriptional regulator [Hungatella sp.]|nr:TetR family transcriptional regulator [Hungatella sp.]